MKHFFLLIAVFMCLCTIGSQAQLLPALQAEQDACNAIPVCGGRFTTPYSYHGAGKLIEQSEYGGSDACFSETNSVWLKLTVAKSGTLAFTIVPYNSENDYDFAVFDITSTNCSDLNAINRIRCNSADNYSCYNGFTGLSNNTSGTITGPGKGADFISSVNALTGNVYLVLINNFSFGQNVAGFTIDFSASTATFSQPKPTALSYATTDSLVPSQVVVHLTGKVQCSSIAANGSDFTITPDVAILSATGRDCRVGGYTSEIVLNLAQPLAAGKYTLNAQQGIDGNTLVEFCGSALALPDNVVFTAGNVPSFVPPTPAPPKKMTETPQPGFTLPAGPWRKISYTSAVAWHRMSIAGYKMPAPTMAKAVAAAPENVIASTPVRAVVEQETTIPSAGWRHIENEGVVSTEKMPTKTYRMTWLFAVPELVEPGVSPPTQNYIPKTVPPVVAKERNTQPQAKPVATAPPAVAKKESTPKPVPVTPPVASSTPSQPIMLLATRWRKMSFTGAILSPKYSMARHRRPRIADLDAMLQKPTIPKTIAVTAPISPPAPVPHAAEPTATVNIVIPDNFSPNGDGVDDSFKLGDIKFLRIVEFTIYDKNGLELYSSTNNSAAWDGQYKGRKQDAGIYQYAIRLAWPDGRIETHKGNVELLR